MKIGYVKGDDFTNDLVTSLQNGTMEEFRRRYRNADLFLVDDIQFIAGKERIQEESDELVELPRQIKEANEALLMVGSRYCFERLESGDRELKKLTGEINEMRAVLKEKVGDKADLEDSLESAYSLMHGLFGHDVMNLFDRGIHASQGGKK